MLYLYFLLIKGDELEDIATNQIYQSGQRSSKEEKPRNLRCVQNYLFWPGGGRGVKQNVFC